MFDEKIKRNFQKAQKTIGLRINLISHSQFQKSYFYLNRYCLVDQNKIRLQTRVSEISKYNIYKYVPHARLALSPCKVAAGVEYERLILFRSPKSDRNDIITGANRAAGLSGDGGFAAF